MAGAGEGSFGRQEEFVLQEVVYSGGEAAGDATGGGGIAGGYQPGKVGNLHEKFAGALGLAVEVVEGGGLGGVGEEVGVCPGLDAIFFGLVVGGKILKQIARPLEGTHMALARPQTRPR